VGASGSGKGSMLAESVQSVADSSNLGLLLGGKQATQQH
jgi:hypothetical protein